MSPLSQMWCLFETVGLHGRVATGFRDQCRSRCTGFWRSSSIPTGATAVFRCGRGGRPSYWSPAGRENRSSPAGMVDASSGGRYWARNDCSTDGCCSASGAAGVAARSSATVVGAIAGGAAEGALVTGGGIGAALDGGGGGAVVVVTGTVGSTTPVSPNGCSGHDRYRRNHDADRDESEHANSDRARPSGPGPAFPRRRIRRGRALVLVAHALDKHCVSYAMS